MKLVCLGSGSKGNCYLLENEKECLVIEAGLPFRDVKKALNFNIQKIVGVCVSHRHFDHSKYAGEYEKAGIPVYKPYEGKPKYEAFGGFKISAFPIVHDVPCYGFFISHKNFGNLLYASDTEYIRYRFNGEFALNHILVEANYEDELIDWSAPKYTHVKQGHMSIQTTIDFLKANDNPGLFNVVLLHLSDTNSDERKFKQMAKDALVEVPVYIARPGLEIELRDTPF